MINYYKLLDIPDFSDAPTIRAAYLAKVKIYHPDLNQNPENEEIMKWINKAYHALSKPAAKERYDRQLRNAYLQPVTHSPTDETVDPQNSRRKRYSKEDIAHFAAKARQSEIDTFERKDATFSYGKRISLGAILTVCGAYIVYLEWFRNEDSYDHFYLIGGAVIFLVSLLYLTQCVYRRLRIAHFYDTSKFKHYESLSVYGFASALLLIPIFIWQASLWRHSYHLSHYAETTIAELLDKTEDKVVYAFYTSKNEYIMKIQKAHEGIQISSDRKWILIRYSRVEPRITEMVGSNVENQLFDSPTK